MVGLGGDRRQGNFYAFTFSAFSDSMSKPYDILSSLSKSSECFLKDYARWIEPGEPSHPPVDLLRLFPTEEMKV
jgi:hypothetical protein